MGPVLLIANPPQPKVDAQVTASLLELPQLDANLKAAYSVPEIWMADHDESKIRNAAARFAAAGMRVVVVPGEELVRIPTQLVARGFTFEEQKLVLQLPTAKISISYDHSPIIIRCSPRAAGGLPPAPHMLGGLPVNDDSQFVDFFLRSRHGWSRVAIFAEHVDFAGLGEKQTPSPVRNMLQLFQLLQRRFTNAIHDERLVNVQLRRRASYGETPRANDARKGYSYASLGLEMLLQELAPNLKDMSQAELAARLCFLTSRS